MRVTVTGGAFGGGGGLADDDVLPRPMAGTRRQKWGAHRYTRHVTFPISSVFHTGQMLTRLMMIGGAAARSGRHTSDHQIRDRKGYRWTRTRGRDPRTKPKGNMKYPPHGITHMPGPVQSRDAGRADTI